MVISFLPFFPENLAIPEVSIVSEAEDLSDFSMAYELS